MGLEVQDAPVGMQGPLQPSPAQEIVLKGTPSLCEPNNLLLDVG